MFSEIGRKKSWLGWACGCAQALKKCVCQNMSPLRLILIRVYLLNFLCVWAQVPFSGSCPSGIQSFGKQCQRSLHAWSINMVTLRLDHVSVHERSIVEMSFTTTDHETFDLSSTASAATVVPTVCNGREVVDSTTSSLWRRNRITAHNYTISSDVMDKSFLDASSTKGASVIHFRHLSWNSMKQILDYSTVQ